MIYFKEWVDYKLRWDPKKYGGIDILYVPSLKIWVCFVYQVKLKVLRIKKKIIILISYSLKL